MTNIDDAIAELKHSNELGYRAVLLSAFPSNKGYPTPEDDRFWAASLDLETPVTIHIELNRLGERSGPLLLYPNNDAELVKLIGPFNLAEQVSRFHRVGGLNTVQMVLDGLFDRFPTLKIYIAETHGGWLPFFMHMADLRYDRHWAWAERLLNFKPLKQKPSEYIKRHIYWGFLNDPTAVKLRDDIGTDRLMWATDFPHQESDWPGSQELIEGMFQGVPVDEKYRMIAGNAIEFFRLNTD